MKQRMGGYVLGETLKGLSPGVTQPGPETPDLEDRTSEILDESWPPTDPDILERKPRRCLHPKWKRADGACGSCGKVLDPAVARRGRTSRNRGNRYELEVAAKLGGRRVGMYGDKVDVQVDGWLRVQCKNGTAYPARIDGWLRAIPAQADILRAVVIGDAPGPGGKRRSLIVLDLDEFVSWYATTTSQEATHARQAHRDPANR